MDGSDVSAGSSDAGIAPRNHSGVAASHARENHIYEDLAVVVPGAGEG